MVGTAAGQLTHYGYVEQKTVTADANGDRTEAWTTFCEGFCRIETGRGREFFNAKQVMGELTHQIIFRYQPGIRDSMRFRYPDPLEGTTRYFKIESVVNAEQSQGVLLLMATEAKL